jgi:mono/diheme cytochrome c family protein
VSPAATDRRALRLMAFLVVAGSLAAYFVAYTVRHRAPPVPSDPDHARILAAPACLDCHGPDGGAPRGPNHPLNDRCFDCHDRR